MNQSVLQVIPVQYCDIMRFMVLHNRHHKVSQSVPFFMRHKTVTILLTIRVRGHFVMSVTKNHESHYVAVLDNSPSGYCPYPTRLSSLTFWYTVIKNTSKETTKNKYIFFPSVV